MIKVLSYTDSPVEWGVCWGQEWRGEEKDLGQEN